MSLTSRDKRFLIVCAVIAAASIWVGVKYFYKAFPEASVEFAVSQDQAKDAALKFLAARGVDVSNYRYAGIFGYDDSVKTFLEKDMGLEQANAILGTRLHLWRWANRWFVPLQKEEYLVSVTTRGEVARFTHLIPEEREVATVSKDSARARAETFLADVMGWSLSSLTFVEDNTAQRPKRTDYTFTWKERDWSYHDAEHRISVEIDGDAVGAYNDFVHVPEQWMRGYRELRSQNITAQTVDQLFMVLLIVGMLVVFMQNIRRREVRWRVALIFGAITATLAFLAAVNASSIVVYGYDTTETYASFLTKSVLNALLGAVLEGLAIAFFTAAAESLYREFFPNALALQHVFRRRTVRTKSFFISVVLGLTLTCFFFAYQTVFYLVANAWGAWAPADVPFDNLMNTKLPWVFVLLGGFFPAVSEEFIFRMFAIPFLQRLFKQRWLAIVLAAFIWGFGHAAYPNEPFFIRGLEVGVAGVIIGVIMIRYGILATLVWHYTVDALYSAILMLRSGNPYYVGSGAVSAGIMLIPLAICVIAYLRHKSFAAEDDLLNARDPVAPPLPAAAVEPARESVAYTPLSTRAKTMGLVAAVLLAALLAVPVTEVGESLDVAVTRGQAETAALEFLKARGVDVTQWHVLTTDVDDPLEDHADRYIIERRDIKTLNAIYDALQPVEWRTRLFKELQREEYRVFIHPKTGAVFAFRHDIADDAPGAQLTQDSALTIAKACLAERGVDVSGYTLKESKQEDRKARRDFLFTWETTPGNPLSIDEARARVAVRVAGAEAAGLSRSIKVPEEWVREYDQSTMLTAAHGVLKGMVFAAFFLAALWLFIVRVRQGVIVWRTGIWIATVLILILGVDGALGWQSIIAQGYDTTWSLGQFIGVVGVGVVSAGVLFGLVIAVAVAFATSIVPDALASLRGAARRLRSRDAAIGALVFCGCMLGMHRMIGLIDQAWPAAMQSARVSAPDGMHSMAPIVSVIGSGLLFTTLQAALIAIAAYIVFERIRRPVIYVPLALLAAVILHVPDHATPVSAVVQFGSSLLPILAGLAVIRWVLRSNALAYLAAFFCWVCARTAMELVSVSAPYLFWNGVACFAVVALVIGGLWMSGRRTA